MIILCGYKNKQKQKQETTGGKTHSCMNAKQNLEMEVILLNSFLFLFSFVFCSLYSKLISKATGKSHHRPSNLLNMYLGGGFSFTKMIFLEYDMKCNYVNLVGLERLVFLVSKSGMHLNLECT